jgi:hypothetical protein
MPTATETPAPTATETATPTATVQPVPTVIAQGDGNAGADNGTDNRLTNIVLVIIAASLIFVSLSTLLRRIPTWRK